MNSFKNSQGQSLYAVAFNIKGRRGWRAAPVEYVHAEDASHAKAQVIKSHPGRILDVFAVGPAIGAFVEDNHGEVLSAS